MNLKNSFHEEPRPSHLREDEFTKEEAIRQFLHKKTSSAPLVTSDVVPTCPYSHGLEKVYRFENVNPSTVKPLSQKITAPSSQPPLSQKHIHTQTKKEDEEEREFAFIKRTKKGLPSFRLKESIEILGLSPQAQKALLAQGMRKVEDICHMLNMSEFPKGLGQGHLEETKSKVLHFLGEYPFALRHTCDFCALLRILFQNIDSKERFITLAMYGLEKEFQLSPVDACEVQRWQIQTREKVRATVFDALRKNHNEFMQQSLSEIISTFILAWLSDRHGIAKETELSERLFMLSEMPCEKTYGFYLFLKDLLEEETIWKPAVKATDGVYAKDMDV